jgi:uncharacterized protein YjbJ (UPF0337 family)
MADKRTEGKADELKGRAKEAWGDLTDDEKAQREGKVDQVKGKAKEAAGNAKKAAKDVKEGIKKAWD